MKDYGALVRGGPEQGQQLMEALVVGCMDCCIMLALKHIVGVIVHVVVHVKK